MVLLAIYTMKILIEIEIDKILYEVWIAAINPCSLWRTL